MHRHKLPLSVSVDWSFGGTIKLVENLTEAYMNLGEIFLCALEDHREIILSIDQAKPTP